jgi:CubicO group peptidase (beta-lactamase class C family)
MVPNRPQRPLPARLPGAVALVLLLPLLLWGCGGGDGSPSPTDPPPPPPPTPPQVASVTVTLGQNGLEVGQAVSPQAEARAADGTVIQTSFSWTSTAPGVATVSTSGEVRGRTAGTTTIRATAGGVTGSLELAVAPLDLGALVAGIRTERGLPALGGAIVTRDGLVGIGVAGERRAGSGPPVTLEDRWHIGSNLKAITGALAAVAVSRGALSWDLTVADAFPELDAVIRSEYRGVTLRDLLANRGRIRNDAPGGTYAGPTARAQREAMVAWALTAPPIGPVGAYHYSNPGFVIAGAIVERALGGDFEDLLGSEFMEPLGATSLGWGPTTGVGGTDQPVGHRPSDGSWDPCEACDNPPGLSAAGRAHVSLGDWAKVVQEFLKADQGSSSLISGTHGRTLFTGITEMTGSQNHYSLGWIMTTRAWGGRTATHSGSNVSNHSTAWLGLDAGVGFLVVTNAYDPGGGTNADMNALVSALLERWQALP